MITRRTVFLVVLVGVLVIWVGVYQQAKHAKDQKGRINGIKTALENIKKESEAWKKAFDKRFGYLQHLPLPTNSVVNSYHKKYPKKNYEDSWIQDIDKKTGRVLVTTIDSKMSIIFKPSPENLEKFHVGWLASVTFQCTKFKKKKCDYDAPYKLFVSNGLVEVEQLIFPKK